MLAFFAMRIGCEGRKLYHFAEHYKNFLSYVALIIVSRHFALGNGRQRRPACLGVVEQRSGADEIKVLRTNHV